MSSPEQRHSLMQQARKPRSVLAGQEGLEPPTAGFGDRDSSQLSYCPVMDPAVTNSRTTVGDGPRDRPRQPTLARAAPARPSGPRRYHMQRASTAGSVVPRGAADNPAGGERRPDHRRDDDRMAP